MIIRNSVFNSVFWLGFPDPSKNHWVIGFSKSDNSDNNTIEPYGNKNLEFSFSQSNWQEVSARNKHTINTQKVSS